MLGKKAAGFISLQARKKTDFSLLWGRSSVGRALEWHSRGRRFDPDRLHFVFQVLSRSLETVFEAIIR